MLVDESRVGLKTRKRMFSPRRYTCALKRAHGKDFCHSECPARDPGVYEYARVERVEDIPAADPRAIDVAVMDMNHGWPNLGHDSLVRSEERRVGKGCGE